MVRVAVATYRILLLTLPRDFRREHGAESVALFRRIVLDARADRGFPHALRVAVSGCSSLLRAALEERGWLRGGPRRSREHATRPGRRAVGSVALSRPSTGSAVRSLHLIRDLRLAGRALRHSPGFTAAAVLTLALGAGSTTAIYAVVDAVILRPFPAEDPDRLVQVVDRYREGRFDGLLSFPNFLDYREGSDVFARLGAIGTNARYQRTDRETVTLRALYADGQMLEILDARVQSGRLFDRIEEQDIDARSMIVSDGYWRSRLGADPNAVGSSIALEAWQPGVRGEPRGWQTVEFTIVGVLAPGFEVPPVLLRDTLRAFAPDILLPFGRRTWGWGNRGQYGLYVLGELREGVALEQAQAQMDGIIEGIRSADPDAPVVGVDLIPLPRLVRDQYWAGLRLLWGAAGFVLLIGAANLANLLLARTVAREGEIAVYRALGASRWRILRRLLAECGLVGALGGTLGVLLAIAGTRTIVAFMPGDPIRLDAARVDLGAAVLAVVLAVGAALAAGFVPALRGSRRDPGQLLHRRPGPSTSGGSTTMHGLVAAEIGVALVLLVGAGLMVASFQRLTDVDPGFDRENLLLAQVGIFPFVEKYRDSEAAIALNRELRKRVEALPGVVSAGLTSGLPLSADAPGGSEITLADRPAPSGADAEQVTGHFVTVGYLDTLRPELLEGRLFRDEDVDQELLRIRRFRELRRDKEMTWRELAVEVQRHPVPTIVNETFARRYWHGQSAIGKRFYWGVQDPEAVQDPDSWDERYPVPFPREIVGVVSDVKVSSLQERPLPHYYVLGDMAPRALVVRTEPDPVSLAAAVAGTIGSIDPANVSVEILGAMEERYAASAADTRSQMILVLVFAGAATFMASIGMLGVLAYQLSRRRWEFGVRMALGARVADIVRLVMRQGMLPVFVGVVAGIAGAAGLTRFMVGWLYGVAPLNPSVFLVSATLLLAVTATVCFTTAVRAGRLDPNEVLGSE